MTPQQRDPVQYPDRDHSIATGGIAKVIIHVSTLSRAACFDTRDHEDLDAIIADLRSLKDDLVQLRADVQMRLSK